MRRLAPWGHFVAAMLTVFGTGLVLHARNQAEVVPQRTELPSFPSVLGEWTGSGLALSPGELTVLGPGDFLLRDYARGNEEPINLFVAYYLSQRFGATVHSPRNCLPGAGWAPLEARKIQIPRRDGSFVTVNRYIVGKGSERMLVLYWFQAHGRVTASEYWAKFFLVADSVKLSRSDGGLVRISTSFDRGGETTAEARVLEFAMRTLPLLEGYLPR